MSKAPPRSWTHLRNNSPLRDAKWALRFPQRVSGRRVSTLASPRCSTRPSNASQAPSGGASVTAATSEPPGVRWEPGRKLVPPRLGVISWALGMDLFGDGDCLVKGYQKLLNMAYWHLIYLTLMIMVIFHSYVSLPEGYVSRLCG